MLRGGPIVQGRDQLPVRHFPVNQRAPCLLTHPASPSTALDQLEWGKISGVIAQPHKAAWAQQRNHHAARLGVGDAGDLGAPARALGGWGRGRHHGDDLCSVQSHWEPDQSSGVEPVHQRLHRICSVSCALWSHTTSLTSILPAKQRLDLELLTRGLAPTRQRAQQLIRAGRVRSGDQILDKPGMDVKVGCPLSVESPARFVSRGGEKLEAALLRWPVAVKDRICLDAGISTGGFTDCLLQRGAARVYGIDVGYGQTAWSLRTDPRVVLRERTNLRRLTPEALYGPDDPLPDLAVADLSFISLELVLPALQSLLKPVDNDAGGHQDLLLLVKPQFQVGRGRVGKGGVVRDPKAHLDAIWGVAREARSLGLRAAGVVASPITGPAGNHEYLLWLKDGYSNNPGPGDSSPGDLAQETVEAVVAQTLMG